MKISIAMATYNGAQYIKEQLQSFVAQTRQPDELIITDDCSTDHTEAIVNEFAKIAPFYVEFHRNEKNLGYCGNFNEALLRTTGDLVFLSDQDDVWFPNKLEHMSSLAERNPEVLVLMNDAALTDGELNEVGLTKIGQIRSAGFGMEKFVMGCCCAIRRELLNLCIPIPVGVAGHDNWLVAFSEGLDAKIVEDIPLQYYRRHESNESQFIVNSTTKVTRLHSFLSILKNMRNSDAIAQALASRDQLQYITHGIERAKKIANSSRQYALNNFSLATQARLNVIEMRLEIRNKKMASRALAALRLYKNSGYEEASGIKSLVKDIFF